MDANLNSDTLNQALELLGIRLRQNNAAPIGIVVCGGSALILTGLIPRSTKDVDVIALMDAAQATLIAHP